MYTKAILIVSSALKKGIPQFNRETERLYLLACVTLAVFAFGLNWATGHRGVFLLDQSMIFDGGWRILQGQTPYKEFLMPFGPVTFYIQAFSFLIFGVNWSATVVPACLLNAFATMIVIRIVRLLVGGSRLLALFGGLATAICFQAPFGTLWLEQTAMFFDLLALLAVVESIHKSANSRYLWQLGSGFSLGLAALSKQNYGLFFIPIIFAVAATGALPSVRRACRSLVLVGIGLIACFSVFLGWVWVFSDVSSFVQRTLVVAGEIGRSRMTRMVLAQALTFDLTPNLFQIDIVAVFSGSIVVLVACFNLKSPVWLRLAPACATAILLPLFRSFAQATTLNELPNNFAFVGLTTALGMSLLLRIIDYVTILPAADADFTIRLPSKRSVKVFLIVAFGFWGVATLAYVGRAVWMRHVQQFAVGTRFRDAVSVRGMERVRWGDPTSINKTTAIPRADFEGLVSYLSLDGGPFFVMGDSTILYGLLGVPSPQPLLYFLPSHSFLKKEIPYLDELVLAGLLRNRVAMIIREKVTFLPEVHDAYAHFPRTWGWFQSNFEHVADYGNYEIWKRSSDSPK